MDAERLRSLPFWRLGLRSLRRLTLVLLGRRVCLSFEHFRTEERLNRGLCIVLPGIEGRSTVNDNIVEGLVAGGYEGAVEAIDWTRRGWHDLINLLRMRDNVRAAQSVVRRIHDYWRSYPGRPVSLVGHSGGAGMAVFVLRQLRTDEMLDAVVLLAAAISAGYPVSQHLSQVQRGIWNFSSPGDYPTVGLGTRLVGTIDRQHSISAGVRGFQSVSVGKTSDGAPTVFEKPFRMSYIFDWNLGGHLGCTNSAFVARHVAPIVSDPQ